MRMAIIAITTSSSISVKAPRAPRHAWGGCRIVRTSEKGGHSERGRHLYDTGLDPMPGSGRLQANRAPPPGTGPESPEHQGSGGAAGTQLAGHYSCGWRPRHLYIGKRRKILGRK